jgi:hypothetical protein
MIIAGAIGIFSLAGVWLANQLWRYMFDAMYYNPMPDVFYRLMTAQYVGMGIIGTVSGILGILGGIVALKKCHWNWALAGSIAGILTFFPVGIAAIVLLSMGREEFK